VPVDAGVNIAKEAIDFTLNGEEEQLKDRVQITDKTFQSGTFSYNNLSIQNTSFKFWGVDQIERFVWIIDERCNTCAKCISACPRQVFELKVFEARPKGYIYVTEWLRCDGCGECIDVCNQKAIETGEMVPSFTEKNICYFEKPGSMNTKKVCELVASRVQEGIKYVVVASVSGSTALMMAEHLKGLDAKLIVFTIPLAWKSSHPTIKQEMKEKLISLGVKIMEKAVPAIECGPETIECTGFERSRVEINHVGIWEILHGIGGQGLPTAVEAIFTAVEEREIPIGSQAIGIGGTGCGADTAIVMKATPYEQMLSGPIENRFDILDIIALPKKKLRYW